MKVIRAWDQRQPFKMVEELLRIHHNKIVTDEDDRVVIVTGDTGSGKSNFAKHLFHLWYSEILNEKPNKKLLDFFCFGLKDWTSSLKYIYDKDLKYRMLYNDEAVNILYYRDSTSKSSKLIKKNFNIIRYLNTYHVLTIPNCHELDPEIVRNRVSGMWYLHKYNGKRVASYFKRSDLLELLAELKDTIERKAHKRGEVPRVTSMKAFHNRLFYVYPSLYEGWINDGYMNNKHEQAGEAINELFTHANPQPKQKRRTPEERIALGRQIIEMQKAKKSRQEIYSSLGLTRNTYYNMKNEYKAHILAQKKKKGGLS